MNSRIAPTRDELMRQYEIGVDLYKHHLKLALELNVFYYAVTGALLSYYFAHKSESLMKWSLLLPFAMSILFAGLLIFGGVAQHVARRELFGIRNELGFRAAPETLALSLLLYISAALMLVVACALGSLIWC